MRGGAPVATEVPAADPKLIQKLTEAANSPQTAKTGAGEPSNSMYIVALQGSGE